MTTSIPLTELHLPGENTYPTPTGDVTVYPQPADNELGFVLTLRNPPPERPRAPSTIIACLWTLLIGFFIKITSHYPWKPTTHSQTFRRVVPAILRDHLVIVTPPPGSAFPSLDPLADHVRVWFSFNSTVRILRFLRQSNVSEYTIVNYRRDQLGLQRLKAGKVVFVCETAIYITDEIGPLPPQTGWADNLVALEGHTIDRELVVIHVPAQYVEAPIMSGEDVLGEFDEGSEEESQREEESKWEDDSD